MFGGTEFRFCLLLFKNSDNSYMTESELCPPDPRINNSDSVFSLRFLITQT